MCPFIPYGKIEGIKNISQCQKLGCFQSMELIDQGYCTSLFLYTLEFDFDGIGSVQAFEFDEVGIAPIER